jgi:hypothetical protein
MDARKDDRDQRPMEPKTCFSVDWLGVGQGRVVEINGRRVTVRVVGQKGRRARVAIEAPAGTVFSPFNADIEPTPAISKMTGVTRIESM